VWRGTALRHIGDFPTWKLVQKLQSGVEALCPASAASTSRYSLQWLQLLARVQCAPRSRLMNNAGIPRNAGATSWHDSRRASYRRPRSFSDLRFWSAISRRRRRNRRFSALTDLTVGCGTGGDWAMTFCIPPCLSSKTSVPDPRAHVKGRPKTSSEPACAALSPCTGRRRRDRPSRPRVDGVCASPGSSRRGRRARGGGACTPPAPRRHRRR
jgi:hypothetical protein